MQTAFYFVHEFTHFLNQFICDKLNPDLLNLMSKACIIGGGLTGLVQAWQSHKAGQKVTLFETNDSVGGVLQSERIDGYLLDYGANTLSLRHQKVVRILEELGMLDQLIDANPEASLRFIVRSGKVVSLPHSLGSFFSSPFLSAR